MLLHGSGPAALLFLPFLERLEGVRAVAVDRPGFGLSDPAEQGTGSYRESAATWLDRLFDVLGLEESALLGSSAGGTWALWYSLAHPDRIRRLALLGAPPLLSATRVPPPMLAVASPPTDGPPTKMPPPSRETVVQSMDLMGEANTIVDHPDQIEALIAAARDPVAGSASITEL